MPVGKTAERKRRVAPAVLEDAGNPIEKEEDAFRLVEGKLHLSRAKGLDGDDVALGELQNEHRAVRVDLKKSALALLADGQGKFLADLKIRI